MADLTDFLENGLYDPALVRFDPDSTTKVLEPTEQDLAYSIFRPDLTARGATDGRMPSGLPRSNDDALSRRDMGLEFLDVTAQVDVAVIDVSKGAVDVQEAGEGTDGDGRRPKVPRRERRTYRLTNNRESPVDTHLLLIASGLPPDIEMENATGRTSNGDPYRRVFLPNGVLLPGQSIVETLRFRRGSHAPAVSFTLRLLSGQGNP